MRGSQYTMIMLTLVLILGKVSAIDQRAIWDLVAGAWFMAMIISIVRELQRYGKKQEADKKENGDANDDKSNIHMLGE